MVDKIFETSLIVRDQWGLSWAIQNGDTFNAARQFLNHLDRLFYYCYGMQTKILYNKNIQSQLLSSNIYRDLDKSKDIDVLYIGDPIDLPGINGKKYEETSSEKVDIIICFGGLHHMTPVELENFHNLLKVVSKPTTLFFLREHACETEEDLESAHRVHDLYNAIHTNITEAENRAEVRNFKKKWNFPNYRLREELAIPDDPTKNILFVYSGQKPPPFLSFPPHHSLGTMSEWAVVDFVGKLAEHTKKYNWESFDFKGAAEEINKWVHLCTRVVGYHLMNEYMGRFANFLGRIETEERTNIIDPVVMGWSQEIFNFIQETPWYKLPLREIFGDLKCLNSRYFFFVSSIAFLTRLGLLFTEEEPRMVRVDTVDKDFYYVKRYTILLRPWIKSIGGQNSVWVKNEREEKFLMDLPYAQHDIIKVYE